MWALDTSLQKAGFKFPPAPPDTPMKFMPAKEEVVFAKGSNSCSTKSPHIRFLWEIKHWSMLY